MKEKMKRFSLKAIAAVAVMMGGLCMASPAWAADEKVGGEPGAPAVVDSISGDSARLEALRMRYIHEEQMELMRHPNNGKPIEGPVIVFLVIGLPVLVVFLFLGYNIKKRHDRERLASQTIVELAKTGQPLTPELISSLKAEGQRSDEDLPREGRTARAVGMSKLLEGVGFLLAAAAICYVMNPRTGVWFLIPGFFLLAQGIGLLWAVGKERKDDDGRASQA